MNISFSSLKRLFFAAVLGSGVGAAQAQTLSQTSFSHFENVTSVATLTASGTTGTLSWAVAGTDGSLFTINSSTGALSFSSAPDFEDPSDADSNNVYAIQINLTD
ncbi:MAG: hypothetical protein ACO3GK_05030, partial [Bacteroidia bacterium]